jgi:hypothetical protein
MAIAVRSEVYILYIKCSPATCINQNMSNWMALLTALHRHFPNFTPESGYSIDTLINLTCGDPAIQWIRPDATGIDFLLGR